MKKLSVLIALALLVVAGTGYAVTCAQDNVPGATLLVPYFKVSGNGVTTGDIPAGGTDTLCAITNVSAANIYVHVTVWNKYSFPVLDFNVPMTGFDVAYWSMRDVLNGKLNVNSTVQNWAYWTSNSTGYKFDPCGQLYTTGGTYLGYFLNGGPSPFYTPFVRFSAIDATDQQLAISIYNTPAFTGTFRARVWSSLDESGDISDWFGGTTTYIIDNDNWVCYVDGASAAYKNDFTGYVTIDVANFCTLKFPADPKYYSQDAIATMGWGQTPGPNILIGDIFFVDGTANTGNISGDPMVSLEFDSRLNWQYNSTFYYRYYTSTDTGINTNAGAAPYQFRGDGREALAGNPTAHYAFRYVQDNLGTGGTSSLRTWIQVWRGDYYFNSTPALVSNDLCGWWQLNRYSSSSRTRTVHNGFTDSFHTIGLTIYDTDETPVTSGGGPSGGGTTTPYIFLETQRLIVTPNGSLIPSNFLGGWVDLVLAGYPNLFGHQAWVGVQHTGYGLALSVGHTASLINNQFVCMPRPTVAFPGPFPAGGALYESGLANQTN